MSDDKIAPASPPATPCDGPKRIAACFAASALSIAACAGWLAAAFAIGGALESRGNSATVIRFGLAYTGVFAIAATTMVGLFKALVRANR